MAGLLSKACSLAQRAMRDQHLLVPNPQWDSHAAAKATSCPESNVQLERINLKQPSIWKTGQLLRLVVLIKKKAYKLSIRYPMATVVVIVVY